MAACPTPASPLDAVEAYLDALVDKDLAKAPLADDVRFVDPLAPALTGKAAVHAFLAPLLPAIRAIEVEGHLVDGNTVATQWTADTVWGRIPVFELFRVEAGLIVEARAYFDPRPILAAP